MFVVSNTIGQLATLQTDISWPLTLSEAWGEEAHEWADKKVSKQASQQAGVRFQIKGIEKRDGQVKIYADSNIEACQKNKELESEKI